MKNKKNNNFNNKKNNNMKNKKNNKKNKNYKMIKF